MDTVTGWQAGLRIRITSVRIRLQPFTFMRIRIQLFILMRIRISHQSDGNLRPLVNKPSTALFSASEAFVFNADPDPFFPSNTDMDPASKNK